MAFYYLAHNNRSEAESSVQKSLDTWNQSRDEWHTRNTVASGVQLIASLVAVDRIEDANKVLIQLEQTFQNKDKAAIESASLQTSFDAGYFDLTVELMKQLPFELGSKTGKIVIRSLESRGLREAALKWAEAGKTPAEKFSRRLELMQTHLFPAPSKKQESRIESLKPVISLMQPGEQALAWAHLGRLAQELQFPDIAQSCKQETELLIKQGPAAQQIPMPDVVETYLNRFNHQEQIYKNTLRTLTQLEYSLLLQKLLKNKEAWDSILEAVNFARVTSPDYLMVKSRYDEIANNESAIRKELETKLKIKAADWRVALPEYRRNMYVIHQEMEESQKLLSVVLVESIKAGFHEEAYKWFKEGEGNQLFNQGIIAPQIPGALSIAFEKIADKNRGTEFIQLENTKKAVRPSEWNIQIKTEKAVAKRDFKAIASSLKRSVTEEDLLTMIYTTIYVAKREEPSVYIEWLREIRSNDEYREKSLQFASAIYGMNGKGVEFYNTLVKSTPEGNEKIFAVKGLTQSLMERNPKPTSSADKK